MSETKSLSSRSGSLINPQISFHSTWPVLKDFGPSPVVVYDRNLLKVSSGFRQWISQFKYQYPVQAGESLKDIEAFPGHMTKLVELTRDLSPQKMSFVAVGGGSVGDFVGLVASLFKRGVTLFQVPSTWLAAIDSSHGGKTALNVGSAKNQIGTFYGATRIFILKPLLLGQPKERIQDGLGELVKIALIDGQDWTKAFFKSKKPTAEVIWKFLPQAIEAKYRVIKKDPCEIRGARQILNLGHTMGHLFEVLGPFSHGVAVGQGLYFALRWSAHQGWLSKPRLRLIETFLENSLQLHPWPANKGTLGLKDFRNLLMKDKKRENDSSLQFIFLRDFGRPVRHLVSLDELIQEAIRQEILKPLVEGHAGSHEARQRKISTAGR